MPNLRQAMMAAAGGSASATYQLWSTGINTKGQLGLGDTTARSSPVQVGTEETWTGLQVDAGWYASLSFAVISGQLWAWGSNDDGGLGDGTITYRSSPVQIGALETWTNLASGAGEDFGVGVQTNGKVFTWGASASGATGHGDTTSRCSPTQVGSLTDWEQVACGEDAMVAVKTDGTLWAWGKNGFGFAGQGAGGYANYSSPVQIGSLTNWARVAAGAQWWSAVKTDGTMWCCGRNTYGQLGEGSTTDRSSPVQAGSATNWSQELGGLACGHSATMALATDNTLWGWGKGGDGVFGMGHQTNLSTPAQSGALTDWSFVSVHGDQSLMAIKSDGTLWACGTNDDGELGLGDQTARSSPTQVGSDTDWGRASGGANYSIMLKSA